MAGSLIPAPPQDSHDLATGSTVVLDASVRLYGSQLVAGGHPWRLLRLPSATAAVVERWREPATLQPHELGLARNLVNRGFVRVIPSVPDDVRTLTTVVIPVYNDASHLDELLAQLQDFVIVVVDDASTTDDVAQVVARHGARYERRPKNAGPAAARNHGASVATTPYLCFLDADVRLDDAPADLARLVAHFVDPLVAAVAPRVRGRGDGARGAFETRFSPLDLGGGSGLVVPGGSIGYVPSAALVVRRDAFGEGFDHELRTGEDVDFVWRLSDEGWLVRYDAEVVVHHDARATWSSWWRQRHSYGTSAAALAQRHPDRLAPVRADAVTAGFWLLLALRRWQLATPVLALATRGMARQLPRDLEDRDGVARDVVHQGIAHAGAPLARSVVRSYFPLLVLGLALRRTRRLSATLLAAGVLARFVHERPRDPRDVLLGAADDAAYAAGVWRGAVTARRWSVLRPRLTWRTAGLALRARDE